MPLKLQTFTLLLAVACLPFVGCDDDHDDGHGAEAAPSMVLDVPTFREAGEPHALYRSQSEKPSMYGANHVNLVEECPGPEPVALTYSWYQPDTTVSDKWVIGVGFSAVVSAQRHECYRSIATKYGAKPYT